MSNTLSHLIELLKLEKIDDLIFRGASQDLGFRQVFGGQVVAQALSAAMQVAPTERILHSCHAYFLAPGDSQYPIIYDVETLREGLSLIFQKLQRTLEQQGLKKMETKEAQFDTDFHEAVALFPTEDEQQKNHIIDCVQTGYMLNDKVLRHAKVVVGQ